MRPACFRKHGGDVDFLFLLLTVDLLIRFCSVGTTPQTPVALKAFTSIYI